MTPKIHLTARPANEGARRLVWLLLDRERGARRLLNTCGVHDGMIDRMVAGEIVPGLQLGLRIFALSDEAIRARHWNTPAQGGWFDRPEGWPMFRVLQQVAA